MRRGFLAPALLLVSLAAMAGSADFRPSAVPEPELPAIEPVKPPDSAGLTMEDLLRFSEAVEFEEGYAPPAEKAARWKLLSDQAPRLAEEAAARSRQWESMGFVASMKRERAVREAQALDWPRLTKLLAEPGPTDAQKAEWAARYVRAYEELPGFGVDDLDAMLRLFPPGPLTARLESSRDRALAEIQDALKAETRARPELWEGLSKLDAGLAFSQEDGRHVLSVVSKKTGESLYRCRKGMSGLKTYPVFVAREFADEVAAFLGGGRP